MKKRTAWLLAALVGVIGSVSWLAAQPGDKPPGIVGAKGKEAAPAPTLDVIGSLSASHLYQTYLNIGLLADGRAESVYDTATARQLLGTVLGLVDSVEKQLARVPEDGLSREDKEALAKIRKQSAGLRGLAAALDAFWKSSKPADGEKYERLRKEAWAGIQELLGTDE